MKPSVSTVEPSWAKLGVLLNVPPADQTPDLERLLLQTAATVAAKVRLFDLAASWLVPHGSLVARHRLRRLVIAELSIALQPRLGLLIDSALAVGAEPELAIVREACRPARIEDHGPLADVQRGQPALRALALKHGSDESKFWGVRAPPARFRAEALRPPGWVMDANPRLRERALRRGDLRCSIVESLRRDGPGWVRSESELARLAGASRGASRHALAALVAEGDLVIESRPGTAATMSCGCGTPRETRARGIGRPARLGGGVTRL
jgi:hypothetical protein